MVSGRGVRLGVNGVSEMVVSVGGELLQMQESCLHVCRYRYLHKAQAGM